MQQQEQAALRRGEIPSAFRSRLESASRFLLMMDFDGTLAPFEADPADATPYPQVEAVLDEILESGSTRVALVTGRPADRLVPLVRLCRPVEIWGIHGAERLHEDGTRTLVEPGGAETIALSKCAKWVRDAGLLDARSTPRLFLEQKTGTIALHWRGAGDGEGERVRSAVAPAWSELVERTRLGVMDFSEGIEVRSMDVTKGTAVRTMLDEEEAKIGLAAAYLGDDLTDEDAFAAIRGRGLGVLVRPELRPTAAEAWLRPPPDLLNFLRLWAASASQARAR